VWSIMSVVSLLCWTTLHASDAKLSSASTSLVV
jgi:hypothetical protein